MNAPTPDAAVPQISRILAATDFSLQAGMALQWAGFLAHCFKAKLTLLHVIDIFSLAETGSLIGGFDPLHLIREQADKDMLELKQSFPEADTHIREGSPRPEIVDAAVELNSQIILIGTHGRSGLSHLMLGSVAEYVVRHSKVPVLTIRTHPT